MSYDLDVMAAPCDHAQTLERYVVNPLDFRTLNLAANPSMNMRAPVQLGTMQVYVGGQLVSPTHPVFGYSLVKDPDRLESEDTFFKIVFNKQVRVLITLVEVSYFTRMPFCLKCNGFGVLNDLKRAANGGFLHIFQTSKMVQKVLKFVLASTCPFYPQYTNPIKTYIGKKFGVTVTDSDIANAIATSLQSIKTIQNAQRTVQNLDPLEQVKDVTNILAVTDPTDPTAVRVTAQVSSFGTSTSQPIGFSLTTTKTAQFYSPGQS